MDWAEALKTRFSALYTAMMVRIDWLRDVSTGFGQAALAIALKTRVIFDEKRRMVRMDWADGEERNGREGYGGRRENERWDA